MNLCHLDAFSLRLARRVAVDFRRQRTARCSARVVAQHWVRVVASGLPLLQTEGSRSMRGRVLMFR